MVVTSIIRILYGSLASHGAITRCLCICDEPLFLRLCSEGKMDWSTTHKRSQSPQADACAMIACLFLFLLILITSSWSFNSVTYANSGESSRPGIPAAPARSRCDVSPGRVQAETRTMKRHEVNLPNKSSMGYLYIYTLVYIMSTY